MAPTAETPLWFHVMNRDQAREETRLGPEGSDELARCALDLLVPLGIEVHAFCLMGTHYHLLVCAPRSDPRAALCELDAAIAAGVRRARPRVVPLAFGRHVAYVSRYIHLNPVRAGLVTQPEDWLVSSYRAYLDPAWCPSWVTTERILGWFGSTGPRQRYRLFVEEGRERGSRDFFGRRRERGLGEEGEFREELARRRALASLDPLPPAKPDRGD